MRRTFVADEGRAAPSNSEMMVSLPGVSGREVIKCSKPALVLRLEMVMVI
jgi:hypothetical protein